MTMRQFKKLWAFIPKPESKTQFVLVLAMLLLLPLLAILQYRWLGQVSEGERAFLKANLNTAAERLSRDFNEELTRLLLAFVNEPIGQPGAENLNAPNHQADVTENYVSGFRKWQATSAHPQWVKGLYFVQFDLNEKADTERLTIRCLEPSQEKISDCQWPEQLREFAGQYEKNLLQVRKMMMGDEPPPLNRVPQGLFGQIPALLMPLRIGPIGPPRFESPQNARMPKGPNQGFGNPEFNLSQLGFVLVYFDQAYLSGTVLPALVKEHFASESNDYDIAITTRGDTTKQLYSTTPNAPLQSNADVAVSLFSLQPHLLRRTMLDHFRERDNHAPQEAGKAAAKAVNKQPPNRPPMRAIPPPFMMAMADGPNAIEGGQWQLLIRHRAGSLTAAVGQARRRNLMISFGILLLLSTSLIMLMSSVRKSQNLAQAQMDFVAGVSHELRTPLSVIDAAGYNLTKGHIKDPEQLVKYGGMIRQESRRLIEMVEQILEFAGAQSKQPQYDLQPVDLRTVIDATCAAVPLSGNQFKIEQEFEKDLPPVFADATALQRALHNLLTNAMKYSGDSRRVQLVAQRNAMRPAIDIEIRDHGLGIPSAELPHIFEPFYRGKEVRAAQIHGNGLGLSLVKKIIEAHGGQISVNSEEGRGSTFTVSLPIQTV